MPVRVRFTALIRGLLLSTLLCIAAGSALAKDEISLQLKWKHAFQFAGYYIAKEKGYFDEAGLNVTIIEGSPDRFPLQHALSDTGRYAVTDSGVLLSKVAGKPVKVLAAIFQHSPLALAVTEDSDIRTFQDLRGKQIMMQQDKMDASILAALNKSGLSDYDFIRQNSSYNLNDLTSGKTDAFSVYTTDQPHQLKEMGVAYRILHPIQYDIDFYGDILITSAQETRQFPKRTAAFIKASIRGWHYALEHVDETINLIRKKYNTQNLSLRQLEFEASKTGNMILKDEIELGYISDFRWNQIAKTYAKLGFIPEEFSLEDFIYRPDPGLKEIIDRYGWQLIISGLVFLLFILATQTFILRKLVRNRTQKLRDSEALQTSISAVLEMIASGKLTTAIFEEIIHVFESRYPNMRASILLLRDGKLYKGAAPNLPDEYNSAIEGLEIGPMVGSCGTAAFLKKRIIVEDIATDPHWAPYTGLALPFKLLACWSEPIFDPSGEVLGTFAMYYDHPCAPTEKEIADISNAAWLAGIVMKRDQSIAELQKLSRAIDQAAEVITITNSQGIIEYVNPAFTQITGYSSEEAIGKRPWIFRPGNQDAATHDEMLHRLKSGNPWRGKVMEKRKDSSLYPAMLNISPVRNDKDEITHYVGVHEDLTEIALLEEQFQQAQKMEAIGTLVGGIAHDFNNMLAGITGNLFLAKRAVSEKPEVVERLDRIETLSLRATDMIKQMLTFANKGRIEKKNISISAFVKEAITLHRVSVPENIELKLNISDDLHVSADTTQLQQILLNLLTNARDAVKQSNHPRIQIQLEPFSADSSFQEKHNQSGSTEFAHLSVSDNGHGIDPKQLKNIYDPFFTTKEVGKGTGLGLSMVFGSIKSHNGIIEVDSRINQGTTFHIYLPLIEAELEQSPNPEKPDIPFGSGECILVADDDPFVVQTTAETLAALGYQVLTASNGSEAVKLYQSEQHRIDLTILDVVMPGMGGKAAANAIRQINPEATIMFATGYDPDSSITFELTESDETTLQKPFSAEELSRYVQAALLN